MIEKEIAELRRRFRPDKNNITHIHGCYVNEKREVVSEFHQSLSLMPPDEAEKMLSLLKKTLSGTLGKNLMDITFSTQQVVDSEEHKLLMSLRNSELNDEAVIQSFCQRIIQSLTLEGQYLILLAYDKYDVPYQSKDGEKQEDAASEVFSYVLCGICPVKLTKPVLSYYVYENEIHNSKTDWLVSAPELGFLFPAFDDRSANIYNALYYSHNTSENHMELVDAIFNCKLPMPAAAQKEAFEAILTDALAEDCSFEVVQAVHEQLCDLIEAHKESKEEEPLFISGKTVGTVLESCGVAETHVAAFHEKFTEEFGEDTGVSPRNIVDAKQFEVRTPDVTVHVNPECGDQVETRIIDGKKYLLIRVDESVEVNGVSIHIS